MSTRYDPNLPDGPEFYFSGNRYCESDLRWIQKQLMRLTEKQQDTARDGYREVYLKEGRVSANKWLLDFCNKRGVPTKSMQELSAEAKATAKDNKWIQEQVEKLMKMQKANRPRIIA